ncbi:hypothetical protein [Allomesorhizobium alhagi]|uniref:Transmembrane protein n=1 Tax=Mesorhizobium alhagi CCNWXJ12-2 TaxID=1107882 RepID=H0I106_9HYPH|nr:hypothetical protein [Mesorhizobium alhagi]EHK53338.1 hypothetical protein MAXJ12_30717 [Mesorhizobium alhagi CCNWXJ12-2]
MSDIMANTPAQSDTQPPLGIWYSALAILVGALLLAAVFWADHQDLDFNFTRLLVYSSVAAMFAGIGSTAAVSFGAKPMGQAGVASGAAAIAVFLAWSIGVDPPPKLSMTYYINFPDTNVERPPGHFKATVEVIRSGETVPSVKREVPIQRAPGGNVLKVTVSKVSSDDLIIVRLRSAKENKSWASAAILPTESFMNLNEEAN